MVLYAICTSHQLNLLYCEMQHSSIEHPDAIGSEMKIGNEKVDHGWV